ncbi:MAG: hypothetical protein HQL06_01860 [Nitrospirae bacterium]|nr:hypothetical protein [Nitrospirota bacterium]
MEITEGKIVLNRRRNLRYSLNKLVAGGLGSIIEVSRTGTKLRKNKSDMFDKPETIIPLAGRQLKCRLIWQDEKMAGLEFLTPFEDVDFIIKNIKRLKDAAFRTQKKLSDEAVTEFIRTESTSTIINLMAELESKNTNLKVLKELIYKLPGLTKMVTEKAGIFKKDDDFIENDVDFAVKRLGIDTVKKTASDFIKIENDKSDQEEEDNTFDMLKILKAVLIPKLSPFFGYKDQNGEASALMSLETKGIEILLAKGGNSLQSFYKDPSQIYSEMTRFLEKMAYDKDLLQINSLYTNNFKKTLSSLFDGYLLAHLCRNPHYNPDRQLKICVSKINLSFAYIAYIIFLAAESIIESKKASINILLNRLLKTGMDTDRLISFIDNSVKEANSILKDIGRRGSIKTMSLTRTSVRAKDLFAKDAQSTRFISCMSAFAQTKRLIIRYEDETYAHYLLGKVIDSEDFSMYSSVFCVIPCENISQDELSPEAFSYFNLVILKNFDKLNKNLMRSLLKLWNTFDGSIILTFSSYNMVDYSMKDLFNYFKEFVIDLPSPFSDERVYKKMVEHTLAYSNPFSGNTDFEGGQYLNDLFSMNQIRGNELIHKVQQAAKPQPDPKQLQPCVKPQSGTQAPPGTKLQPGVEAMPGFKKKLP